AQEKVWKEGHGTLGLAFLFLTRRRAHAMFLHQEQMQTQNDRENGRQHGHMDAIKTGQRCPRYIISTAQQSAHERADDGYNAGYFCSNSRGKEGKFIPWQEISGEAESESQA